MSIYGRRKGLMDFEDHHQPHSEREAPARAHPYAVEATDANQDWSQVRRAYPADYLLPMSEKWLEALPHGVLPIALIAHFPRIVNLIAMQSRLRSYWYSRTTTLHD